MQAAATVHWAECVFLWRLPVLFLAIPSSVEESLSPAIFGKETHEALGCRRTHITHRVGEIQWTVIHKGMDHQYMPPHE